MFQDIKNVMNTGFELPATNEGFTGIADQHANPAETKEFADLLLAALVLMATRSKRRQAELLAVLRRANLPPASEHVGPALSMLREAGLIQDMVPLYDGGMLISVTSQGMERPRLENRWAFLERRNPSLM